MVCAFRDVLLKSLLKFLSAITCEWWNYIWIQEGLSTLFEFLIPDDALPEYRLKDLFNLKLQNGLRFEANDSTRPMTNVVDSNAQLPGIFNTIAYDKCEVKATLPLLHKFKTLVIF